MKLSRRARLLWLRILRQKDEPERIGGGLALGVFLGFVLPPGVQTVVALALAPLLRCNLLTAALGTLVTNPFTMPFVYPAALKLGQYIAGLPGQAESVPLEGERFWTFVTDFRAHGRTVTLLWLGLITMGAVAALPVYYMTRVAVERFRQVSRRRRAVSRPEAEHE